MLRVVWIIFLLVPQCLYGGDFTTQNTGEKAAAQEGRMQIDGQTIDYIHFAFNDYLKHHDVEPKAVREMKYYSPGISG